MALQVKAFREFRDFQAKIVGGLSWRQLAVVAVWIPSVAGLVAVLWWARLSDVTGIAVALASTPFAAVGWYRKLGIPFEKYVGFWWRHRHQKPVVVYEKRDFWKGKVNHGGQRKTRSASRAALGQWESHN